MCTSEQVTGLRETSLTCTSDPIPACLLVFWNKHFPPFTHTCWAAFFNSCFGTSPPELCLSVPMKTLSTPFKLFLMTSYYCKCFMLFGLFQLYSALPVISFFLIFCLSWLLITPSSPRFPQISAIYIQRHQLEILLLCPSILPSCLGFFLVHFTPSSWGTSSVYGPASSCALFVVLWVTSQLNLVPSLRALLSAVM